MARNHRNHIGVYNFIWRLYRALQNPDNHGIIDWTDNGNSFTITNLELLVLVTLPREFNLEKFNSFHRQLNIYGFRKNRQNRVGIEFTNPNFRFGHINLLTNITNSSKSC
jgi:hypothetical protein